MTSSTRAIAKPVPRLQHTTADLLENIKAGAHRLDLGYPILNARISQKPETVVIQYTVRLAVTGRVLIVTHFTLGHVLFFQTWCSVMYTLQVGTTT